MVWGLNGPLSDRRDLGLKDSLLFGKWKFGDRFWLISCPFVIGGNSELLSSDIDELGCDLDELGGISSLFFPFLFDPKFWKKLEIVCSLPPCLFLFWKKRKLTIYVLFK